MAHATVHHCEAYAVLAREHAHCRATGQEVFHHLPGHIARIGRHAARGQAVVASKHHQLRVFQFGRFTAQHQADALPKALNLTQ